MLNETHIAHGIAVAQERAAATAKLRRIVEERKRILRERLGSCWMYDDLCEELDAVLRAWEEET